MGRSQQGTSPVKVLLLVIAITMVAIGGAYAFLLQTETPHQNSSSSSKMAGKTSEPVPSIPLQTVVNEFLQNLTDKNVNGLVQFYYTGANVIWSGNAPGLTGGYSGAYAIQILYGSTVGKLTQMTLKMDNYVERESTPADINVTFTLMLNGTSAVVGRLNGTIDVSQEWAYSAAHWEIVKENWNYRAFNVEIPQSATTFPQWSVLKEGKSPDLVSEKSFEWNAGPFVAAGVYAFMFGVVLLYASRTWSNKRPA